MREFYWKLALWLAKGGMLSEVKLSVLLGEEFYWKLALWLANRGMFLEVGFLAC